MNSNIGIKFNTLEYKVMVSWLSNIAGHTDGTVSWLSKIALVTLLGQSAGSVR